VELSGWNLYRVKFKTRFAVEHKLVWAKSEAEAYDIGRKWCEPQGFTLFHAVLETLNEPGQAVKTPETVVPPPPVKPIAVASTATVAK